MELLTIAEIAKMLHTPESTIRSWRDRYAEFIPSAGKGRKKRYPKEAYAVFQSIAEMSAEGLTATAIAERLAADNTRLIEHSSNNSSTTAIALKGAENSLQQIADALEKLTRYQDENKRLHDRIDQLEERLQQIESDSRPWYKRIGRKR